MMRLAFYPRRPSRLLVQRRARCVLNLARQFCGKERKEKINENMKSIPKRLPVQAITVVILMLSSVGCVRTAPDLSTPKKTVLAFEDALQRNDMVLAKSIALGNEQQLAAAKMDHDLHYAMTRCHIAISKRFPDIKTEKPPDDYAAGLGKLDEQIEGNKATVKSKLSLDIFAPNFKLERIGETWKVDLRGDLREADAELAQHAKQGIQRLIQRLNEITQRVEKGYYKTAQETEGAVGAAMDDFLHALAPESAGTPEPSASPTPTAKAPTAKATIDEYEFCGLKWGSSVSALRERFPNASKDPFQKLKESEPGVEFYILWRYGSTFGAGKNDIGDVDRAELHYFRDKLYQILLRYDKKDVTPEALLERLKKRFGEPDPNYSQEGYRLIYRWIFPKENKVVFLIPPQGSSDTSSVELRDDTAYNSIPKPVRPTPAEGF